MEYKTRNLQEAAFFVAKGMPMERTENTGSLVYFIFADAKECEKLKNVYYFGDSTINAKHFYDALMDLKRKVYETQQAYRY